MLTDTSEYADKVMAMLDDDIEAGIVPATVRTFSDLHSYVDANEYTLQAGVPWGADVATDTDPAGVALVVAVEDEVERRLNVEGRPFCTYGACNYPQHDHTTTVGLDGLDLAEPIAMLCNDCEQPTHYNGKIGRYEHDDPTAPACFLIACC